MFFFYIKQPALLLFEKGWDQNNCWVSIWCCHIAKPFTKTRPFTKWSATLIFFQSNELFTCKTAEEVKALISKGAKIDTRNNEEATPLIAHTKMTRVEVVKELIDQRANVDLQDAKGYSALIYATKSGNWEIVQILVANGAILDLKEKEVCR